MIVLGYLHGLRASEVVALTVNNLRDGYLTVQRLKGSRKTVQQLMEHSNPLLNEKKALFEYTRGMHGVQRLFPITRERFWQIMQKHARAAGIPKHKRHPHVLKHSIAMTTIELAGIEHVRQWLGHKSLSSTGQYLQVTDDEAAQAVKRALNV